MRVFVTYLEQTAPPVGAALSAPMAGLRIGPERLGPDDYLHLYRAVGDPHQWSERLRLPQEALTAVLQAPSTLLLVLRMDGRPVGLCEFVDIDAADVELKYFGLVGEAQGRGLGPYLLDHGLRHVWTRGARRVWLHTDTNDHHKARATYERSGFRVYDERWQVLDD